jgi:2-methylisocitrate lyase-like PEP mutase family enzyme
VPELAALGVRRVSTGGVLARVAYGALVRAAAELRSSGDEGYAAGALSGEALRAAL